MKWMLSILFCTWIPTMVFCQDTQRDPSTSELPATSLEYESYDLKTSFDSIHYLGEDSWKVYLNGKVGFIDEYFSISIPPEYDDFLRLDLLCIGVKKDNLWAIYSEGEFISDFIFSSILKKEGDCYVAIKSGGFGCYNDGVFIEEGFYIKVDPDIQPLPCDPETGICATTPKDYFQLVSKYLRYPAIARENGQQGTVVVNLYISEFGDLDHIEVINSIGDALDNEVIYLFSQILNQFNPAEMNGIPVPSVSYFPIRFRLE